MSHNITLDLPFYERLFRNSTTVLLVTENETGEPINYASENFTKIFGYDLTQIAKQELMFDDLIHEQDIAQYLLESQQGSLSEACDEICHSELKLMHYQGHYIWVKDTVQLVRENNIVTQLVHIITDITEEVLVRQQINGQKERLVKLLHNSGFGLWEWFTDEDDLSCDENWSHLIGFVDPIDNMKMSRLYALVHPDDVFELRNLLNLLVNGERDKGQIIIRMRHLSGKWRYHLCNATFKEAQDNHSSLVSMSHSDITEQKENELAAIAALSTRNQFFARVSHEIRTPLHGILGMLSIVKKEINDASPIEKIDKVISNSEHLLYLLNDVLDLAKLNEAKLKVSLELTSITEVIKQVERLFAFKAIEKSIELKTELPSLKNDMIMTDKVRITQVLSNLVSNAIKYTHQGEVNIYTKFEDDKILLCVQDSGIGIKNKKDIFEAYRQESGGYVQRSSSTGLGLEIVKKLCDILGIDIRLHSNVTGTTFELLLGKPMPNTLAAVQNSVSTKNESAISLEDIKILVVDDSDINREIVMEMLTDVGANCVEANDGYQAVKLTNNNEGFQVVLMDKHMPNMNGLDATFQIRNDSSLDLQPIIIGLTADAFDSDNEKWFNNGLDEVITKPFDVDILLRTIHRKLKKA